MVGLVRMITKCMLLRGGGPSGMTTQLSSPSSSSSPSSASPSPSNSSCIFLTSGADSNYCSSEFSDSGSDISAVSMSNNATRLRVANGGQVVVTTANPSNLRHHTIATSAVASATTTIAVDASATLMDTEEDALNSKLATCSTIL